MGYYKRKTGSMVTIFIYVTIFMWHHFFYLFSVPEYVEAILWKKHLDMLITGVSILIIIYFRVCHWNMLSIYTKWIMPYFGVVSLTMLAQTIFSQYIYSRQSIIITLQEGANFSAIIMALPLIIMFIYHNGTEKFFSFLNFITFIWYLLIIFQVVHMMTKGFYLWDFANYTQSEVDKMFYFVRIPLGIIGNVMIIYNFSALYESGKHLNNKGFSIVQLSLGLFCLVFVQQTRGYIIAVVFGFLSIIALGKKKTSTKIKEIILIIVLLLFIINNGILGKFLESFDLHSSRGGSTKARLYAIGYYIECFMRNPMFGNGFAGTQYYNYVEHGPQGIAYYNDVGIFGLIAQTGICSITLYIMPVVHMIKTSYVIYKKEADKKIAFFSVGLMSYIIASSGTLIITDSGRAIFFPIVMAYLEYHKIKCTHKSIYYQKY